MSKFDFEDIWIFIPFIFMAAAIGMLGGALLKECSCMKSKPVETCEHYLGSK